MIDEEAAPEVAVERVSVDTGGEPEAPAPDPLAEQFESMGQRLGAIEERLPSPDPDRPPQSLADQLTGEPPELDGESEYGISDQEVDQILEQGGGIDDEGDLDVAAFDQLVQERVQEGVERAMAPFQQAEQAKALNALAEVYPDITNDEIFQPMQEFLLELQERHGNEALALDPAMVEMAYKAIKAEQAGAAEVPAESADSGGAVLETGAGPSQQGEPDPGDEYRKAMESFADTPGAF